jgi:hypothetical protein
MCIAPFRRAPHKLVRRVLVIVRTMTVSVRNPQQKFRQDTVVPMEVLSLYADPIWLKPAGSALEFLQGCGVSMQPALVLGHYTHRVSWNFRDCQVANSERCLT